MAVKCFLCGKIRNCVTIKGGMLKYARYRAPAMTLTTPVCEICKDMLAHRIKRYLAKTKSQGLDPTQVTTSTTSSSLNSSSSLDDIDRMVHKTPALVAYNRSRTAVTEQSVSSTSSSSTSDNKRKRIAGRQTKTPDPTSDSSSIDSNRSQITIIESQDKAHRASIVQADPKEMPGPTPSRRSQPCSSNRTPAVIHRAGSSAAPSSSNTTPIPIQRAGSYATPSGSNTTPIPIQRAGSYTTPSGSGTTPIPIQRAGSSAAPSRSNTTPIPIQRAGSSAAPSRSNTTPIPIQRAGSSAAPSSSGTTPIPIQRAGSSDHTTATPRPDSLASGSGVDSEEPFVRQDYYREYDVDTDEEDDDDDDQPICHNAPGSSELDNVQPIVKRRRIRVQYTDERLMPILQRKVYGG